MLAVRVADELPRAWRRVFTVPTGGLTDVAFGADEWHVIVVSHSGSGVIEAQTGRCIARDAAPAGGERTIEGIGPLAGEELDLAGLSGGALDTATADGWRVEVRKDEGGVEVRLARGAESWTLDRPITDVRAAGFSPSSALLVIATASELTLFERVET